MQVPLVDVQPDMGPVHLYPGTHHIEEEEEEESCSHEVMTTFFF